MCIESHKNEPCIALAENGHHPQELQEGGYSGRIGVGPGVKLPAKRPYAVIICRYQNVLAVPAGSDGDDVVAGLAGALETLDRGAQTGGAELAQQEKRRTLGRSAAAGAAADKGGISQETEVFFELGSGSTPGLNSRPGSQAQGYKKKNKKRQPSQIWCNN